MPSDHNHRPGPTGILGRIFGHIRWLPVALSVCAVLLLAAGADAQTKTRNLESLNKQLFTAVRADQDSRVRSLLTAGADPMATNDFGMTPAGLAIERGNFKMAHYILSVRNQRAQAKARAAARLRERSGAVPDRPAAAGAPNRAAAAPIPAPQAPPVVAAKPAVPAAVPVPPPAPRRLVTASGGRNPFDPLAPAQSVLPTLNITKATAPGETLKPAANPVAGEAPNADASKPGLLGRMVDGIAGVFKSGETAQKIPAAPPAKASTKIAKENGRDVAAAPRVAGAKPAPASRTPDKPRLQIRRVPKPVPAAPSETTDTAANAGPGQVPGAGAGFFGRMMKGIADVVGAGTETAAVPAKPADAVNPADGAVTAEAETAPQIAPENTPTNRAKNTVAAAPEKTGEGSTVLSSSFKNMFATGKTKTTAAKPEPQGASEQSPETADAGTETETVVRSGPGAEAPVPAPKTKIEPPAPAVQIAESTPPEAKAKEPEAKAPVAQPEAPATSASPFSPTGNPAGPLPTIGDPNLIAGAKSAPPAPTGTTANGGAEGAENQRSALDRFLRRVLGGKSTRDAPADAPAPVAAPEPETAEPGTADGRSVEKIAMAANSEDGSAGAEAPATSASPFSPTGNPAGPLPTIGDPNLIAGAKSAPPAPTGTTANGGAEGAENQRSALDRFLRGVFSGKSTRDAPAGAPAPVAAPEPETAGSGTADGRSVGKIAMAGNSEDGSAGAEAPKTRPGPSVATKLDGFFRGLARGFSNESRAKKNSQPEIVGLSEATVTEIGRTQPGTSAEKTSGQESSEPSTRSKLDRFVRSLFEAKPKNEGDIERHFKNNEGAEAAPPPAPETMAVNDAPAAAKGAPQGLAKMTELASRPAARRRLGQRGGRRRSEAIPFIPAVTLTIGESLTLGRTLTDAMNRAANCFQKGKNKGWFCLETADWPDEIRDRLRVSAWIYRKARTIVHYRSGRAQRIFSVFPAKNFNKVVRFLEAKFGPPAEETDQFIALIGAPPKLNLIVKWKRKNADGSISALEVRKFDNVRRMVPDTKIGFIRLYREGSRPIFRTINESDLMLQSLRNSRLSQFESNK